MNTILDEEHAKAKFDDAAKWLLIAAGKTALRKSLDAWADSAAAKAQGKNALDSLESHLIRFAFAGEMSNDLAKILYPKVVIGNMNLEEIR